MSDKNKFRILHLSDLHIQKENTFDRSLVFEPLLERLKQDVNNGLQPEIVIITGDIAYHGIAAEYGPAQSFLEELMDCLDLEKERLFIVPGNHDVYRKMYRKSDVPRYADMSDLNEELENEEYRKDLLKGMTDYYEFIASNYTHLKSLHDNLIPFVSIYPSQSGKQVAIIGLNSAWMSRTSADREKIAIGEFQVKMAMEALKKAGKADMHLFCFHHPLTWLWPKDRERNRRFFNDGVLLSGHLHDVAGGYSEDLDGHFYLFQAGGLYLKSESNWPQRYHYIQFDWEHEEIRLDFRRFYTRKCKWDIDGETGDGGFKVLPLVLRETKKTTGKSPRKKLQPDAVMKKYKKHALQKHRFLPMQGFETTLRTPIEIEQVYVHMRAHIQSYHFDYTMDGRNKWNEKVFKEKLDALDMKKAFQISKQRNIKDMVILGDPGSGKTTLLKYILVMLLEGKADEKLGIDSGIVPFFAPLRLLRDPDTETLTDFMARVCELAAFDISDSDCHDLLEEGRAIVLLDGLDEVADENTRIKVCKWIDKARQQMVDTPFIITSRFAGYLGKSQLSGAVMELSIQDFKPDEVRAFLIRWFETVEISLHPGDDSEAWREKGKKDALELFDNIDDSPHLKKLAVNPLILQIIALIRRDRGTALPQRRVELYQECVNVLLEKWDMAKGLDILISAREARQILQPLALWLHEQDERRSAPLTEIIDIIREPLEDLAKSDMDPEALLFNIRDRSGIFMGYSESEYGFAHLSFQEYLAAEQVRNTTQVNILVRNYTNKWWREVILLSLGLDNPSIIEPFMEKIIQTKHFKTDITLIIDAIDDSLIKSIKPFIAVLEAKNAHSTVMENAVRVLAKIGGASVIRALTKAVQSEESAVVSAAYDALLTLDAASGIKAPVSTGKPVILKHRKDKSDMVLIPAGSFLYGSREDDKNAESDEKPQQTILLPDFYMDTHPVTNRQYCQFLNEVKPDEKNLEKWIELSGDLLREKCRIARIKNEYVIEDGYDDFPVIFVTWYGAKAYASWAGKRLPTEQEWEKAARGTDGRIWPWGNEFDEKYCNSDEIGIEHTTKVGRFPDGKSPYGCYDMAGNVWEWTTSHYAKGSETYVLRGGSWFTSSIYCRCAIRFRYYPFFRYYFVGFRCARI